MEKLCIIYLKILGEESDGLVQLEKLRGALTEFSQKKARKRISDIVFGNREIFPKY